MRALYLLILFPLCLQAQTVIFGNPNTGRPIELVNGGLPTNMNNLLAGEDETNDVIRTEQQFSYCAGIVADGQCGDPATFLHTVTCAGDDAAATAGSLAIRDSTSAGAGTIIQNITFVAAWLAPFTLTFDVALTNGLYLDFTTTADVECSASYR